MFTDDVWGEKSYKMVLNKKALTENLFLLFSAMELLMGLLDNCNITVPLSRYILWGFLLYYGYVAMSQPHEKQELIILAFLVCIGVLLYANSGLNIGIKLPFYLYAMRDIDKRKYCKMIATVILGFTFCTAVAAECFGFGTLYFEYGYGRGIRGQRYCLGYSNPNRVMGVVLMALIFGIAVLGSKMNWKLYVLTAVGFTILYLFTDSRTSYYIGMVILAGGFIFRKMHGESVCRVLYVGTLIVFAGMLIISILAACRVDNGLMQLIDKCITGRMNQLGTYTGDAGYALPYIENWHLFGNEINHNGYDMGYVQIFYYYGIIPGICYILFIFSAIVKVWRNRDDLSLLLILGLCTFLFMESMYFSNFIPMHFVMTYSAVVIWKNNGQGTKV